MGKGTIFLMIFVFTVIADAYYLDLQPSQPGDHVMETLCQQNGGNIFEVERAAYKFLRCMETDFEVKNLENEIKEATYSHSSYDHIIKKYCAKTPQLKLCYNDLMTASSQCLGGDKQLIITMLRNTSDQIVDYACNNEGEVMSKFVNEGGPQCFDRYKQNMMMCAELYKQRMMQVSQFSPRPGLAAIQIKNLNNRVLQCLTANMDACHNPEISKIVTTVVEIIGNSSRILTIPDNGTSPGAEPTPLPYPVVDIDRPLIPNNDMDSVSVTPRIDYSEDDIPPQLNGLIKKCEEHGVTHQALKDIIKNSANCLEKTFDVKKILTEFFETKQNKAFDVFFKKYCAKIPQFNYCYGPIMNLISTCAGDQGKNLTTIANNMNEQMADFACANDGARITKFFKEGGLECFESKGLELSECGRMMNNSLSIMMIDGSISVKDGYASYEKAFSCLVQKLESCDSKVPSEMFKSLAGIVHQNIFPEVRQVTATEPVKQVSSNNSETPHYKTSGTITLTFNADIFV